MKEEQLLADLKTKLESLKRDIAIKEGAKSAVLDRIKKEYGVKTLDGAYAELGKLKTDIEIKQEQRQELLKEASDKLANYKR